jgi:hypothetical protein
VPRAPHPFALEEPSWLSELAVRFGSSSSWDVNLRPGIGDDNPGTKSYSSGGVVDLVGLGLDFGVNADGTLNLEFYETFDDFAADWDSVWRSGALTIRTQPIPEPGTYAMMLLGLGAVGAIARRRKAAGFSLLAKGMTASLIYDQRVL